MHVEFTSRESGPKNLICEAELHFGAEGPLAALRLVGFGLWRGTEGDVYVTFPSRAFGEGQERRYFDYLRGDREAVQRFKAYVLDAFKRGGRRGRGAELERGGGRQRGARRGLTAKAGRAASPPGARAPDPAHALQWRA